MRKLLLPAALIASMALGAAGVAATAQAKAAKSPKRADCVKQWKAEKTHTETRKAFLAACERA